MVGDGSELGRPPRGSNFSPVFYATYRDLAIVGASTVASSVSSLLMLGWLRYMEQQQR
jgi:hypothetical protein